ncbi:hypothetical protein DERP_002932 [Dermatophagoides pteronyssinus]|uniref:3'-5' exonuclease domain-containing protein n=1 Tax=Dermatophagoides pteronyssinus TaxID=6956 RepID=A0ABQ8JWD2_DERPT|nr:hypothetical protein DERP_002932 [Dermatophagoides pteronyssinus]
MADFDVIRDQTLMFFLDHLIGKGQSRTLHDLSCQFGAKGFTKEMRQIAGGSQAGLKKFLLKFPSLFTIDGETVLLTPLISDHDGSAVRDYTKETIEFFTDKLNSYGIAEVPLKSLFGHRSQASSEIRHVSGQNVKEFREFLETYSSIFVVRDDYVVLKSVLDQLEQDGHNDRLRRMPEEIQHDPYLMQQLVQDLEDKVYSLTETYSNKISIDLLYNSMQSKEQLPALWNDFIKVPTDLITFLHMNSRIFLVQGQMVSLTNERLTVLRDKKQQIKLESNLYSSQSQIQQQQLPVRKVQQHHTPSPSSSNGRMARTLCSSQQSVVNQRIRSQIIKIVSQGCHNPSSSSSSSNDYQNYRHFSNNNEEPLSLDNQNDSNQYDSIDLQLIKPRIVVKNKDCEMIVDEIFSSNTIGENCPAIGIDVEGINLGTNGEVTLIQISYKKTINKPNNSGIQIVLFDVFLNPTLIQSGLKKLLESENIVKIGHDVRTNSASLYRCFGITLKNVFDTQVAHLILQQQSTGRPAYKPTKYISFYTLSNVYGGLNLNPKQKDRLHKIYRKDYKYWKNRPLTDEMIQFAVTEVYALYPTVYENIRGQIRTEYEPLFKQLVYESIFAYINVDEIKQLKRQRKFELELTDLKLKLFNNDKKKIVLSNREIRLLRYIDMTEEIRNKIEGPMNVAKKLKRFENRKQNGINNGENNKAESSGGDDSEVGDSDVECYMDTESRVLMDDYYYSEKQTSSLSPSSREYDHSGEFNSSGIGLESQQCCHCHCHGKSLSSNAIKMNGQQTSLSPILSLEPQQSASPQSTSLPKCDIGTQTLSTGDIVITKIYQLNHETTNMNGPLSK